MIIECSNRRVQKLRRKIAINEPAQVKWRPLRWLMEGVCNTTEDLCCAEEAQCSSKEHKEEVRALEGEPCATIPPKPKPPPNTSTATDLFRTVDASIKPVAKLCSFIPADAQAGSRGAQHDPEGDRAVCAWARADPCCVSVYAEPRALRRQSGSSRK